MKEWEYLIDDDRRVTWNSSFPDNELDSSEYGLAFFYSPYYTGNYSVPPQHEIVDGTR